MKVTIRDRIHAFLGGRNWTSGTELEGQSRNWQTKASTISRVCRKMEEDGLLSRKLIHGNVYYCLSSKRPLSTQEANDFLKTLPDKPATPPRLNQRRKKCQTCKELIPVYFYEDHQKVHKNAISLL